MAKSVLWHNVISKQDRHFIVLFWTVIYFNRLNVNVIFVCLSVRLQVSFICCISDTLGRRFSFCTVVLYGESRVVPSTLRFLRKTIEIIFRGRYLPRKLKSAKNNPHVFLDKTAKIWRRENIPLYGSFCIKFKSPFALCIILLLLAKLKCNYLFTPSLWICIIIRKCEVVAQIFIQWVSNKLK